MNFRRLSLLSVLFMAAGCSSPVDDSCPEGDKTCNPDCIENAKQCASSGTGIQICRGGSWVLEDNCKSEEVCNKETKQCEPKGAPDCTETEKKCEEGGAAVLVCSGGFWNRQGCQGNSKCDPESLECKSPVQCTGNVVKCDGDDRVLECVDGSWNVKEQCDPSKNEMCDKVTNTCRSDCETGAVKCDPSLKTIYRCENGKWNGGTNCGDDEYCNADKNKCMPMPVCFDQGALTCDSTGKKVQRCDENGQLVLAEDCTGNNVCAGGQCIPGCAASECRNNNAVTCTEGLESYQPCGADVCVMRDTAAVCEPFVCNDGDFQKCSIDGIKKTVCQNNQWREISCDPGDVCSESVKDCYTPKCNGDGNRCGNNNDVLQCEDYDWKSYPCENRMCKDGACTDVVCSDGDTRCVNGKLQTCSNNAYNNGVGCAANEVCVSKTDNTATCEPFVCENGTWNCDGLVLQKCDNNNWEKVTTCTDKYCNASTGKCERKNCEPGVERCSNANASVMVCENNNPNTVKEPCGQGNRCMTNDAGAFVCAPKVCDDGWSCGTDNWLRHCVNNKYEYELNCVSDKCNINNLTCEKQPECKPGDAKCTSNNELYVCDKTGFYPKEPTRICTGNTMCNAQEKQCVDLDECKDGDRICFEDLNTLAVKECKYDSTAKKWAWAVKETCDKALDLCDGTNYVCKKKPVCSAGDYSCNGQVLRDCVDGQWHNDQACDTSKKCDKDYGKCIECIDEDTRCNVLDYQICVRGEWSTQQTCSNICNENFGGCIDCDGGYKCDTKNALFACGSDHKWSKLNTCGISELCDDSLGKCVNNECSSGQYSCNGQTLRDCVNNAWHDKDTCGDLYKCDANKGACTLIPVCSPGEQVCEGNTLKICNDAGQWGTEDCGNSRVCVKSGSNASCVDKWTLPSWCNIQWIDDGRDQGYGRVLVPNGTDPSSIQGHLLCGDVSTPISTWNVSANAVVYEHCDDCGDNTEYLSYSLKADPGNYQCVYTWDFGPETIICKYVRENGKTGDTPIVLSASTKVDEDNTLSVSVPAPSSEEPSWCWFNHLDENNGAAYGRITLPGSTTPASVTATLICGDKSVAASDWTVKRSGLQNLNCSDCGDSVEFMTAPLQGENAADLTANSYSCAFRFDVNGKSYVCSSNIESGLLEFQRGMKLLDEETNDGDKVTLWGYTVKK